MSGFTIPNLADATWEAQARLFSSDITIWTMAAGGQNGVISGCEVTAQSPEAMAVDVASGITKLAGAPVTVAGNAVAITAANGTYARQDLIYIDDMGVAAVSTGTAAPAPVPNALPADSIGVAMVYVPAADTAIGSTQISDRRVFVQAPLGESQWTTVSKAADETRNSTAALTVDGALSFTMASSTKYRIRIVVFFSTDGDADFKFGFTGPSSPAVVVARSERMGLSVPADSTPIFAHYAAYDTTGKAVTQSGDFSGTASIDAIVHNGANAGDFQFTWAQNTSNAGDTTVRAGSYLEYEVA